MADTTQSSNPYKVLDVERDVDDAGLRRAYRAAVKRCHPDHGGDPAEFLVVQESYEQLSDPQRRAEVDYFLDHPDSEPGPGSSADEPGGASANTGTWGPEVHRGRTHRSRRVYRPPSPRTVIDGWLEARCLFECDIRGITLDPLDQRAEAAAEAAETLRRAENFDEQLEDVLGTWRERVAEVRSEVMSETSPDELGAKIRRGPANRGLFADRALAVAFTAATLAAVTVAGAVLGSWGTVQIVGTSPILSAAVVGVAALWWVPTWVAGWVRLGWGRRARRAAVAAAPTAAILSGGLYGQWVLWAASVFVAAAAAATAGWFADRRLRASFPPPIWGPQRRLRTFRERAAARSEARAAARAEREAARRRPGRSKGRSKFL